MNRYVSKCCKPFPTYNKSAENNFEKHMENPYREKYKYCIELKNIVIKGEIGHYEQFLLLPHCFQKASECI